MPAIFTYDSQIFTSDDIDGNFLKRDINPSVIDAVHTITVNSFLLAYQADPEVPSERIVYGGSLKDTLILNGAIGSMIKFDLGAGTDSVTISKAFQGLLDTGDDADSVSIKGGFFGGKASTGAGNDSFSITKGVVAGAEIDLGDGDDRFSSTITLWDSSINLGEGNNTLSISGVFSAESEDDNGDPVINILGGSGIDKLTIQGNVEAGIDLGLGKDVVIFNRNFEGGILSGSGEIAANEAKSISIKGHASATIITDIGADTVSIGKSLYGRIESSSGDDKVTIGQDARGMLDLGDGNDILSIKRDFIGIDMSEDVAMNSLDANSFDTHANLGHGNDTVSIGRHNIGGIDLGDGSNKITLGGDNRGWIFAGLDNDSIVINGDSGDTSIDNEDLGNQGAIDLGDGDNSLLIKGDMFGWIEGGEGIDTVTINGDFTYQCRLQGGNDKLAVKGELDGAIVWLGAGDDAMSVAGDCDGYIAFESGSDLLSIAGEAWVSLSYGSASASVSLGKGDDEVEIVDTLAGRLSFGAGNDELRIGNLGMLASNALIDFGAGVDGFMVLGTVSAEEFNVARLKLQNLEALDLEDVAEATHSLNSADIQSVAGSAATEFHILLNSSSTLELRDLIGSEGTVYSSLGGELQMHSIGSLEIYLHFYGDDSAEEIPPVSDFV
ncbi:MAG: hypothetical protein RL095_132 [Verrucomicrobiota bacterium]